MLSLQSELAIGNDIITQCYDPLSSKTNTNITHFTGRSYSRGTSNNTTFLYHFHTAESPSMAITYM